MKKSMLFLGMIAAAVMSTGILAGCSKDPDMVDAPENPALKDMPPVPPEAAAMGDGPGAGKK
ncbi:MAG TPA: hypothetical protein PKA27_09630 [Fimbriimonadaceae bacterium]|nr:hypothetical protein [Fimbriimonadaceae bacterium]